MQDKLRKRAFYLTALINFILVAIYEFLTPYISDDIIYYDEVAKAGSFFDLFAQEYDHYMNHSGRTVAHFIMRVFLYIDVKAVFNIVAAAVFTLLSILIYMNVRDKKKYDLRIYILILIMMWLFEPAISNTVFWETGACNYLFTATIIFGYITLFRKNYESGEKKSIAFAVGMLLFGFVTGWCNENSSGGVIFMVLVLLLVRYLKTKDFSGFRLWMITGLIGNIAGFLMLTMAPGNYSRKGYIQDAHSGILAILARFLKIALNIKNYYLILVCVYIVLLIAIAYRLGSFEKFKDVTKDMLLFGLLFIATDGALIALAYSELRAYYCASLFLMTAIAEGFAWASNKGFKEDLVQIFVTGLATVLVIVFAFTYIEQGANLARIERELNERDAYLDYMAEQGEMVVEAPMLRPQWDNRFTNAYESDITEDKFYWMNLAYAEHHGLWYIIGVDREEWTEY